jgi:hypothetical protein
LDDSGVVRREHARATCPQQFAARGASSSACTRAMQLAACARVGAPRRAAPPPARRGVRAASGAITTACASPPPAAWLPSPAPSPATAHLVELLESGCKQTLFQNALQTHALAVAASATASEGLSSRLAPPPGAPPEAALSARIAALRAAAATRAEAAALLALSAAAAFAHARLRLHAAVPRAGAAALPGALGAPGALDTALAGDAEPGAAHELRAHLDNVLPPSSDPAAVCRLDSLSGARLYAGSVQFGYFVSSVFAAMRAAQAGGGAAAMMPADELRVLAKATRSQEAWDAASGRAGALWGLTPDPDGGCAHAHNRGTRAHNAYNACTCTRRALTDGHADSRRARLPTNEQLFGAVGVQHRRHARAHGRRV